MNKETIKKKFIKAGFDLVGVANPEFDFLVEKLKLAEDLGYTNPLVKGTISDRTNPSLIMPEYKSIIVLGLTYMKESKKINRNKIHFSNSSWGEDYHRVLCDKIKQVMSEIKGVKYKVLVDTSPMDDRFLAYSAGLGFYGRSGLLINEKLGTYFFIGSVLTDMELEADDPVENRCMDCKKCQKTCPVQAINDSGILNSFKCRSYLTQKKADLTHEEIKSLDASIFGCDICAYVCPYNQGINHTKNKEFKPTGIEQLDGEIILSNKAFKEKYGHLAGAFIGKKRINRNIKYIKDKLYVKMK